MFWWLLLALLALFAYLKFWKPLSFWEEKGVPHEKPWPIVGNMLPFSLGQKSMFDIVKDMYNNSKNLRYFGIYQFSKPVLIIRDVELAKQVCIKEFEHFVDHQTFFNETDEPVFSENLFAAKGKRWRDLRATLSPVFTGSKMRSMFTLISECSERFNNYFLKTAAENKPIELELKQIYKCFTVDVIGTCVYGIESNSLEDKNNDFFQMGKDIGEFSGMRGLKALGFMVCPALMRAMKIRFFSQEQIDFFRDIVGKTIDFREKNGIVRPDLIHIMMQARKGQLKFEDPAKYSDTGFATIEESEIGKNSNVKLDITDDLITAQSMIFFIGGTDTNATLLSFASHELAVNMDIQKKLQDEIDKVYEECNGKITYELMAKMKYLDMVVSETLRKWPLAYFMDRLCDKDFTIEPTQPGEQSIEIKKGQTVWIPVVGYHMDPKYYPEPERFNPERFSDENKNNINPYTYLPFGQGPRSCIGNRFALLVVKLFLFHFLHKFNFVVTKKTQIPLQISKSQIILNTNNGFWMGIQKRSTVKC